MSTVLLLEGSDLSASQSVTTIAEAAGFTVYHLASQEQLPQYLTQVSETPVIVLAGYEGERSVELQRLRRAAPWASIVLVGAGDVTRTEGAPLVRSVSLNEPAALGEVLREAAQEGIERRRTRRTLDAFNRRLQRILHPVRPHTASLTLSAHYFSGLVHYAPDAILVVDRSGKVIFCNRATERLFEVPQARITGAPLSQICRDAEAIEGLLQQTLAGVAAVASEVMCVLLRGAVLHLELTVAPVEDEQGAVVGASLIARDIGERRKVEFERLRLFEEVQAARLQAERSEQEYRLLAEAMPQIVWTGTAEGQMAYFNSRFTEYTGITDWSRSWSEALVDQRVFLESWRQARERGSAFEAECRLRAHSGTMRWFLARAVPHRTGTEPVRWLGTFTDIDDRRQAESYARFVSEASALLASSLDLDLTLTHLANLCVPFLADWCTVGLVPEEGRLQVLATRHSDPAREREVQALAQLRVDQPSAMEQAAASGRGQLVPVVTDAMIQEAAVTPERYAILQRLGLRSYMVVPFMLRGRVLGVLSFVSAESRRQFGEREFEVAGELAQRAAYAVDNARSYREAQRQSEARGRLSDELRRSEARYRSLTVASAEIVWRTDSAGHMQDMQAWCRWTGQTPAQAVSDWWYRVHPGDRERLQRDWAEVQHDPRALRWECRLGTADG
ncbi:MAG TPA: PAS domain S-box protein, partial [Acidiferrobacteraceae bacterium]|nr:PAS domain S-box protein [Acidiferrobacteraceae bacterium]